MSKKTSPAPAKPALTDKERGARDAAALTRVAGMDDPAKLRNLMANADRMGVPEVREAAFRRLAAVQPEVDPGTVAHDVWQSVFALEQLLLEERGKTVRLTQTRTRIRKNGETKTAADLALAETAAAGFGDLIARGHPDLTFEAVTLRHPDDFDDATRAAATARLTEAGVDVAALTA